MLTHIHRLFSRQRISLQRCMRHVDHFQLRHLHQGTYHSKRPAPKEVKHEKSKGTLFDYSQVKRSSSMIANRDVYAQKEIIHKMIYILKLLEKSIAIDDSFEWEHDPLVFIDTLIEFYLLLHPSMSEIFHDMCRPHGQVVSYFGAFAFDLMCTTDGFSSQDILEKYTHILLVPSVSHPIYGDEKPQNHVSAMLALMHVFASRYTLSTFTNAHLSTMVNKTAPNDHVALILDWIFHAESLFPNPASQITHGQLLMMMGSNAEALMTLEKVKTKFKSLPSPLLDFYMAIAKRNLKLPLDTLLDDFNRAEKGMLKVVQRYNAIQLPWMNELKYELDLNRAHVLFSMGDNEGGLASVKKCLFTYDSDIRAYELAARSILLFHLSKRQEVTGVHHYLYFERLNAREKDHLQLALVYINKAIHYLMAIFDESSLPINAHVKHYLLIRERLLRFMFPKEHTDYERALLQRTRDLAHVYSLLSDTEHNRIVSQLATELDAFYDPLNVNDLFLFLSSMDREPYKQSRARQLSSFIKDPSSSTPLNILSYYDELSQLIDVNPSRLRLAISNALESSSSSPLPTIMLVEQLLADGSLASFVAQSKFDSLDAIQHKLSHFLSSSPPSLSRRILTLRLYVSELRCSSNLAHISSSSSHIRLIEDLEKVSVVKAQLFFARFLFLHRDYAAASLELSSLLSSPILFPDIDVDLADAFALSAEHAFFAAIYNEESIPVSHVQDLLSRALSLDPLHSSALFTMALTCLLPSGDYSYGLSLMDSLLSRSSSNHHPRFFLIRGLFSFNLLDFDSALSDFNKASSLPLVSSFLIPLASAHASSSISSFDVDAFLSVASSDPLFSPYFVSSSLSSSSPSLHLILPHPLSLFNHWWSS